MKMRLYTDTKKRKKKENETVEKHTCNGNKIELVKGLHSQMPFPWNQIFPIKIWEK